MSTLYEISADLRALHQLLEETGGDISDPADQEVIDKYLVEGEQALDQKVEAYCRLIREFEAQAEARKLEADRMRKRSQVAANSAKNLKDRLMFFMGEQNMKRLETPNFNINVQKAGGAAPIEFIDEVPQVYCKPGEPDRIAIRKMLEAGDDVSFARLSERKNSLRIR